MRDWSGSRIREDALKVPCPYCLVREGIPCVEKAAARPLEAFPAHTVRIAAAERARATA